MVYQEYRVWLCRLTIDKHPLCGRVLEISDQVVTFLALLQASENHLGAQYELLGILKTLELEWEIMSAWHGEYSIENTDQSLLVPGHVSLFVGISVGIAIRLASLTAEESMQIGADLMAAAVLGRATLCATSMEEFGSRLKVTWSQDCQRRSIDWVWS